MKTPGDNEPHCRFNREHCPVYVSLGEATTTERRKMLQETDLQLWSLVLCVSGAKEEREADGGTASVCWLAAASERGACCVRPINTTYPALGDMLNKLTKSGAGQGRWEMRRWSGRKKRATGLDGNAEERSDG
ncbi:hypothetical protein EYF80_008153 [Liparis tanakae]|uniref:Uncharacterized protein n=1 Tax=Liparis tanakae TaxID=230148 RepID=A0A4Z2IVD5_9TELE|nr:hypothetical protein EYF80_008153 [Liparis tanakae]